MSEYLTDEDYKTAASHGISRNLAYNRFYNYGWSKSQSITLPVGWQYLWPTYKAQCEQNGITQRNFNKRVRNGMDPEEAATKPSTPPSKRRGANPKLPADVIEQAAANGIGRNTVMYRVYGLKWPVEKAVNTPIKVQNKKTADK